jgi:predicted dehydrogenase
MKRRSFLVNSLLGAVGINLASCQKSGTEAVSNAGQIENLPIPQYKLNKFTVGNRQLGASDKIVMAQIGAGGWGTNLAIETGKLGANAEFKYICDVDDTRGGRAIQELGKIQGYEPRRVRDMRRVFDDPDVNAVIIATPTHWHALAALWAMQAGKDVYVEKCITHKLEEGQIMAQAAMKYGRIIQCGLQNRSADYTREAAEYIKSGQLGKVLNACVYGLLNGPVQFNEKPDEGTPDHIDWDMWLGPAPKVPYSVSRNKSWLSYWDYCVGVSFEDTIHQLDLMRYALGNPGLPKTVTCSGGRLALEDNRQVPDIQSIVYDYGDFTLNVFSGDFSPYMFKTSPEIRYGDGFPNWINNGTKIIIYGTEAMMMLGRHGGGWQVFGRNGEIIKQMPGRFPILDNLRNYLDCIRSREIPNANIIHGHLSSALVHYANISLRLGNKQLEINQENESIMNNPRANELTRGNYRNGFEFGEAVS